MTIYASGGEGVFSRTTKFWREYNVQISRRENEKRITGLSERKVLYYSQKSTCTKVYEIILMGEWHKLRRSLSGSLISIKTI